MPNPNFISFLTELENGHFLRRINEALPEIVAALHDFEGKAVPKGKLTITLDLSLQGDVIDVMPDLGVKVPKPPRNRTIFWATPENNLTRVDPRQGELPMRDIAVPRAAGLA